MRDLAILFIHFLVTIVRLMRPGGTRAVVAESLLVKHQMVILNRGRERAPNLRPMDRVIAGLCTLDYPSGPIAAHCRRTETFHPPRFPRDIGETQIPTTILTETARQTRSHGTFTGACRSHCRDQETESELGLPSDRTTTLSCVWARDR